MKVLDAIPAVHRWAGLALLGAVLLLPLVVRSPYYLDILILTFLWAGLAGAWNLAGGYAGQFSLGHAAFFGIGAYTSSLLFVHFKLSPLLGVFVGAILVGLIAFLIGAVTFRLRGPYFTLASIAFAEVVYVISHYWRGLTRGAEGLEIPFAPSLVNLMFHSKVAYAYLAGAYMLFVFVLAVWVERSRLGYYMIAYREDEEAAESVGIDTYRVKLIALTVSAALTALGGTFYAQYILFLEPGTVFSLDVSIQMALISIIGGLGTALGPVIGSVLLTPLSMFLRAWFGGGYAGLHLLIYGIVLIVVVLFVREGLVALLRRLWRRVTA
jgi:branched-chain amino acid transport system permease protein